ncbi:hypothetical protein FHS18_000474 [Paenibacillus phyllosphaerae]|uniref:Sporulation protein YjcZ n=1 Tax=Paenibacillus phyllosphaerae TaxID=274593 RepID=A0A7W5FKT3_9BACL|nr:YjcZ family sporulation protein [Paenibacillus phyllosphaerae]MBB3108446.1 hypothetical protein [Paenibacillus phyllosphaerae]
MSQYVDHGCHGKVGGFNSAGIILVLFILLVIVLGGFWC